jgi:hypothetical protein
MTQTLRRILCTLSVVAVLLTALPAAAAPPSLFDTPQTLWSQWSAWWSGWLGAPVEPDGMEVQPAVEPDDTQAEDETDRTGAMDPLG